ncbi:MAG: folate-binding protein, partial [Chromatiales bacterium]|nr:folate-binding protein [Chromatiales bacterium]
MKPEWKAFLVDNGAELADDLVAHFGNPERERQVSTTGDVLCDLSQYGLIGAYGKDAAEFLHGQFTNDIKHLLESRSEMNGLCTAKGRLLTVFRVFRRGETIYLRLPRELLEPTLKRLKMYLLRAQATLEDASDALVRIGFSGPNAIEELHTTLGDAPANVDDVMQRDGLTLIRLPGVHPRFEIYGDLEPMKKLFGTLNVHAAPVGSDTWDLLDILAGLPSVHPQTVEAFIPQMLNLQLVNGVSFNKGCYPGQEVVARTQYLGKVKRRMYRIDIQTRETPVPGTEIFDPNAEDGQPVGAVVDAQAGPDGGCAALAVVQIASAESKGPLHLG